MFVFEFQVKEKKKKVIAASSKFCSKQVISDLKEWYRRKAKQSIDIIIIIINITIIIEYFLWQQTQNISWTHANVTCFFIKTILIIYSANPK